MNKIVFILFIFTTTICAAQNSSAYIEIIREIEKSEGEIIVYYELKNAQACEIYDISVTFLGLHGVEIKPFSLSGDLIGIFGKGEKSIIWEYSKDIDYLPSNLGCRLKIEKIEYKRLSLKINTIPPKAEIFIDDSLIGTSPINISLECKTYDILIKLKGYQKINETVQLGLSRENVRNYKLTPINKNIEIKSRPDTSNIIISGYAYGKTPQQFYLLPDYYKIEVSKEGFIARKKKIRTQEDTLISKSYNLKPCNQMGLGYVYGIGGHGGEIVIRSAKLEIITSFFGGVKPFIDLKYKNVSSFAFSGVLGLRIPYPIDFSLHAGWGWVHFYNKNDTSQSIGVNSLVIGATFPIYLSHTFALYTKFDYWINTNDRSLFLVSLGVLWHQKSMYHPKKSRH